MWKLAKSLNFPRKGFMIGLIWKRNFQRSSEIQVLSQKMMQKESGGGREQETVGDVWTGKNTKKRLKRQKAFYEK